MDQLYLLVSRFVSVILNPTIALLFGIALVVFLWGVAKFIWASADNEGDREEGRRHMIWGIVGMFIMVAALGIISIVTNTFGIQGVGSGAFNQSYQLGTSQNLNVPINAIISGGTNTSDGAIVSGQTNSFQWLMGKLGL